MQEYPGLPYTLGIVLHMTDLAELSQITKQYSKGYSDFFALKCTQSKKELNRAYELILLALLH